VIRNVAGPAPLSRSPPRTNYAQLPSIVSSETALRLRIAWPKVELWARDWLETEEIWFWNVINMTLRLRLWGSWESYHLDLLQRIPQKHTFPTLQLLARFSRERLLINRKDSINCQTSVFYQSGWEKKSLSHKFFARLFVTCFRLDAFYKDNMIIASNNEKTPRLQKLRHIGQTVYVDT
jgi:hypothetical protein